jgi:hypothetical protein
VLYNICDVIQKGTSGKKIEGWPSEKQIERFTRTACSPDVVGDEARHGVQKGDPPAKPMLLPEARLLIDTMLALWLENS